MKRPAAAAAATASRTKKITATKGGHGKCSAILAKLSKLEGLPTKVTSFIKRIKVGLEARDSRRLDHDKVIALLGKAIREIHGCLQSSVQDCKSAVDGAEDDQKGRQDALTAATEKLASLRLSALDCKSALKRAEKEVETQRQAIKDTKAAVKNSEAEAKKVNAKKRSLELAQRDAFEPLREVPAGGSAGGQKRLATLRRTGKAFGFHNELLNVAGVVFKKQLDSRRTFDNDVLRHIAREFEKNTTCLDVAARESEQSVEARKNANELAGECFAAAKASCKQRVHDLEAAEQAIVEGQQALVEAKAHMRTFPAHMKHAAKQFERAQLQLERFCSGPQASFEKAFGNSAGLAAAQMPTSASDED